LAVDRTGNVFVTGNSNPSNNFNDDESFTIAYSGAGSPLWTNRFRETTNGFYDAQALAVDKNGNVFVTGNTSSNWITIKYSSSIPAAHLDFQRLNKQVVLSWTNAGFSLQTAPNFSATFTNVPGATSPYTNPATAL